MEKVKLVVIIPVGPGTNTSLLSDTIESIKYYCNKSHKIILVNDSQRELDKSLLKYDVDEVRTDKSMGKQSGLYFSLCKAMSFAMNKYSFDVLLRMDDDALITGLKPEDDAIEYFQKYSNVGMLGSYKVSWDNTARDFTPPKREILIETSLLWPILKLLKGIKSNDISPILSEAKLHDYELGEHVLGGAYFMSRKLLEKFTQHHLLHSENFRGSRLEEDHIFAMQTFAVNMTVADFVTGSYPMILKWKGMPTSPEKVHELGKKVVHSTRFYNDFNEEQVRALFRKYRT